MLVRCSALFCLFVLPSVASSQITVRCFKSGVTHVKFVQVSTIDAKLGYVLYKKSNVPITLIFDENECEDNDDGRPQSCNSSWVEVINGKTNGTYQVMSQGARIYQLDYISSRGVTTKFSEDLDAYNSEDADCVWE